MSDQALEEKILNDLNTLINKDQIVLPTLPEVALKVREAAENPNVSALSLSKVIGNDPALTARVIKIANSPLMRTRQTVNNLRMAISRMGIIYTSNLITGLAMQQMFQATSDVIDKKMREVWNRSTEVAGIAHVLCKHYTNLKADQATLSGLTHEIGILPILTYAEDNPELLQDSETLDGIIRKIHPAIGAHILKAWDFPEEMICVPEKHLDFNRNENPQADYVDIITVAVLQSYEGTEHPYTELDWSTIPAFTKLGLEASNEDGHGQDLSEEMEHAMKLLSGSN